MSDSIDGHWKSFKFLSMRSIFTQIALRNTMNHKIYVNSKRKSAKKISGIPGLQMALRIVMQDLLSWRLPIRPLNKLPAATQLTAEFSLQILYSFMVQLTIVLVIWIVPREVSRNVLYPFRILFLLRSLDDLISNLNFSWALSTSIFFLFLFCFFHECLHQSKQAEFKRESGYMVLGLPGSYVLTLIKVSKYFFGGNFLSRCLKLFLSTCFS